MHKNIKQANININLKDLFLKWLEITSVFHKLTTQQKQVLGLFLYYHYSNIQINYLSKLSILSVHGKKMYLTYHFPNVQIESNLQQYYMLNRQISLLPHLTFF